MAVRPGPVRIAVALLGLVGLGYLVDGFALATGGHAYHEQFRQGALDAGVDPRAVDLTGAASLALPYLVAVVTAGAGVFMLVVALSVRAGHFAGRIVAWAGAGLAMTCSVCTVGVGRTTAFSGAGFLSASSADESGFYAFSQSLPAGYPASYQYLSAGIATGAWIALALVVVLLALPSSSAYFRPPRPPLPDPPILGQMPPGPARWSRRPAGSADRRSDADRQRELAILARRHERGELTDEEFLAARQRLHDQQ